jgi:1,4-alpha-glucan branching enzyme
MDQEQKIVAYQKKDYVFVFNFHPVNSYAGFQLPLNDAGNFRVMFDTDEKRFGGQERISHDVTYAADPLPELSARCGSVIYIPSRTAMVLRRIAKI